MSNSAIPPISSLGFGDEDNDIDMLDEVLPTSVPGPMAPPAPSSSVSSLRQPPMSPEKSRQAAAALAENQVLAQIAQQDQMGTRMADRLDAMEADIEKGVGLTMSVPPPDPVATSEDIPLDTRLKEVNISAPVNEPNPAMVLQAPVHMVTPEPAEEEEDDVVPLLEMTATAIQPEEVILPILERPERAPVVPSTQETFSSQSEEETLNLTSGKLSQLSPEDEEESGLESLKVFTGTTEDIPKVSDALQDRYDTRFAELWHARKGTPGALMDALWMETDQAQMMRNALRRTLSKGYPLSRRYERDGKKLADAMVGKAQLRQLEDGDRLSGKNAQVAAMALLGGIKKVYLYHSGFYVVLRPPLLPEISTFYNSVRAETQYEHGKFFGGFFYLPADATIKKQVLDMFEACVVQSNLKNWQHHNELRKRISLLDYNDILWALASLMHREGVDVEYICSNPKCAAKTKVHLDVNKMRYINFTRIGEEALQFLMGSKDKTLTKDDLAKYRNMLRLEELFRAKASWSIKMDVPSIHRSLIFADKYNTELLARIQISDQTGCYSHMRYTQNRIMAPWVSEIHLHNEGKTAIIANEEDIPSTLEFLQLQETNNRTGNEMDRMAEVVKQYIENAQLTHICYPYDTCPVCQVPATGSQNGMMPCDMQSSFFMLSVLKLGQS